MLYLDSYGVGFCDCYWATPGTPAVDKRISRVNPRAEIYFTHF